MKKFDYQNIRQIHLELSSRCNARCPMCARFEKGKLLSDLPQVDLDLESVKKIFPSGYLDRIELIYISGVYGEPTLNEDIVPILKYLISSDNGDTRNLTIDTNGGARDELFWRELGALSKFHDGRIQVRFCIDGLNKTNARYRRGVNWNKLMINVQAFISAGGYAQWVFIVFQHNEHEVDAAEALAKEMGFSLFELKKTQKFKGQESFPVMAGEKVDYELFPPVLSKYRHKNLLEKKANFFSEKKILPEIDCLALRDREIYISAEGLVFPCCWLGTIYGKDNLAQLQFLNGVFLRDGLQALSAKHHDLQKIVSGNIFNELIVGSWSQESIEDGRLKTCTKSCSMQRSQNTETNVTILN